MEQLNQILILEIFALKFIRENNLKIIEKKKNIFLQVWKSLKNFGWVPKENIYREIKKLKNFT